MGRLGLGGSHSVPCSASSPKAKEPSEEAEPEVVAQPEVRRAGQGGAGSRPTCPGCRPLKPWCFP